jgi:hypothetical protein
MADVSLLTLPASAFVGDENTIIEAGDIPALPDAPSGRSSIKFIDGADESAAVSQSFVMPTQYAGSNDLKMSIHYFGDAAGGGGSVKWDVAWEAITESDAHDMHGGADYFDGEQTTTDAVDAAAGELNVASISATNVNCDGVQPGDSCRLCVRRDSADGGDDYADTVWLLAVEILDVQ